MLCERDHTPKSAFGMIQMNTTDSGQGAPTVMESRLGIIQQWGGGDSGGKSTYKGTSEQFVCDGKWNCPALWLLWLTAPQLC